MSWLYFSHKLPLSWCAVLWTITLFLIGLRAYQAIRVLMARAALSGSQLTFINYEELAQGSKGHGEDLLDSGVWLVAEHSQKLYELMKLDWTKLQLPHWISRLLIGESALPEEAQGLPIIHGVSDTDENLFRPLKNLRRRYVLCRTAGR